MPEIPRNTDPRDASPTDLKQQPTRAETILLIAMFLFGLAVRLEPAIGFVTIAATILLAASFVWPTPHGNRRKPSTDSLLLLVVVAFGALGALWAYVSFFGPTTAMLETAPGLIWMALAVAAYITRDSQATARFAAIASLAIGLTAAVGVAHLAIAGVPGIDVYEIHVAAADAISNGENPYSDSVQVISTAPTAEATDTIVGYGYPPITAVAYAAGLWLFDEPRMVSLISWLFLLGALGARAIRRRANRDLNIMLVLSSLPAWPFVLRAAWTEPLSLLFIGLMGIAWSRPIASGLSAGLAFASKQYFIVVAPLFLTHRQRKEDRRWIAAIAVVTVTLGAGLFLGFSEYWSATVGLYASTPPRPDSTNLIGVLAMYGVIWDPPFWLPLTLGLGAATAVGIRAPGSSGALNVVAISLSAAFLVSEQAFANYWFLVFGVCALALSQSALDPEASAGTHANRAGRWLS